ncbi:hypothetical protein OBBRIDRAFT_794618 [Obba rivulosa]|uniref:Uncharacterized protein n=1 Tax=Obba rivulosa TaxID=1052685 RepID=A0A8E2DJH2_9APHY|nr:hypothetical protein OBBRIDRAFT_794618 [Obba rivulosa]
MRLGKDTTMEDRYYTISESAWDLIKRARVAHECRLRRVVAPSGKSWWCLALACTDPYERTIHTPRYMPTQEKIDRLKAVLMKKDHIEPRWWKGTDL